MRITNSKSKLIFLNQRESNSIIRHATLTKEELALPSQHMGDFSERSNKPTEKGSFMHQLNHRLSGLESKLDSLYSNKSQKPSDASKKMAGVDVKYNKEIDQRSKSIGAKKKKKKAKSKI